MTLQELLTDLQSMVQRGVAPDTLVVVRDMDIEPDPDVVVSYYCEEANRVCLGMEW